MLYVYLDDYICIFSVKKINYNVKPILLVMLSYVDGVLSTSIWTPN